MNGDTENPLNKPLSGVYEVFDRLKTDKNRARIAFPLYEGDTGEGDTEETQRRHRGDTVKSPNL